MGIKIIAKNKRASYDYFLTDRYEAGMVLKGTEVKSLRAGNVSLAEAFVTIEINPSTDSPELWVRGMSIKPYEFGTDTNHEETRSRKLLLNAQEIGQIHKNIKTKGITIVPTIIYFKGSLIKIEIALAKGKKLHDKRESTMERENSRRLNQKDYE